MKKHGTEMHCDKAQLQYLVTVHTTLFSDLCIATSTCLSLSAEKWKMEIMIGCSRADRMVYGRKENDLVVFLRHKLVITSFVHSPGESPSVH